MSLDSDSSGDLFTIKPRPGAAQLQLAVTEPAEEPSPVAAARPTRGGRPPRRKRGLVQLLDDDDDEVQDEPAGGVPASCARGEADGGVRGGCKAARVEDEDAWVCCQNYLNTAADLLPATSACGCSDACAHRGGLGSAMARDFLRFVTSPLLTRLSNCRSAKASLADLARPVEEEAAAPAPPRPAQAAPSEPPLTISLRCEDGNTQTFRVKVSTRMEVVFRAWSAKHPGRARFLFDGEAVRDGATAGSLGLEDGDVLDVRSPAS